MLHSDLCLLLSRFYSERLKIVHRRGRLEFMGISALELQCQVCGEVVYQHDFAPSDDSSRYASS